jgi:hypothetical protein
MRKRVSVVVFFFCLCICSCGTSAGADKKNSPGTAVDENARYERAFWDAAPRNNELVFHGAAGLLSNREESVRLALEDAARKLAVFFAVEGRFYSFVTIGAGVLEYRAGIQGLLTYDQDYQRYAADLVFDRQTGVLQQESTVFVRARYPAPDPLVIPLMPPSEGREKPGWIDELPLIAGYTVGIGYAGRRSSPGDTVNQSFENAVFAIIRNSSALVSERLEYFQGAGVYDFSSTASSALLARGLLRGFYALDTWTDPHTRGVWTLAIAKEAVQY